MLTDLQEPLIRSWLSTHNYDTSSLTKVAGDASFRSYYRIPNEDKSLIVMYLNPEYGTHEKFLAYNKHFQHIKVPRIIQQDIENGILIVEDFGDHTFSKFLDTTKTRLKNLYKKAINTMIRFQKGTKKNKLPMYSKEILEYELSLFNNWYIQKYLVQKIDNNLWQELIEILLENNLNQQATYVHRDYHCRNIIVLENGELGIIDYQDALHGPYTYDLASLLKDVYVELPQEILDSMLKYFFKESTNSSDKLDYYEFEKDFDFMALQRHLKILGIFSRLYLRDGKENYLADMPLTKKYILQTLDKYPVLNKFKVLIK